MSASFIVFTYPFFGRTSEIAQYFFTDDTLDVIGAAVSVEIFESCRSITSDTNLSGWADYLRLYKPLPNNVMSLVAEGSYNLLDTARMMRVYGESYPPEHPDTVYILPIYETYFDKGYTMTDSFYVSVANQTNGYDRESGLYYIFPTILYEWNTRFCLSTPQRWAKKDYGQTEWVKNTVPDTRFWIWPIIDTTGLNYIAPCDTFFCAGVSDIYVPHPTHVISSMIDFAWTGAPSHSRWQLSYGPVGTEPGQGTILDCRTPTADVYGLRDSVHYVCYVRGYCDECSKWGDWSEGFEYWKEMYATPAGTGGGALDRYVSVMPNPASRYVTVVSSFRIGSIEAFDLQGNKVDEQAVDGISATLDVARWSRGTYILSIRTNRGTVARKIVISE